MTGNAGESADVADSTRSKVGRLIEEYDLAGLGADLEERWTGDGTESDSLRGLAEYYNCRLLRAAMEDAGMEPLEGEPENIYSLLTDGNPGAEAEVVAKLERAGIDVESLREDFVSHQSIHTYLTKYRGATYEAAAAEGERRERVVDTTRRMQNRTVAVTEGNLEDLERAGELAVGDLDVFVDVTAFCNDCGSQFDVVDLVERGGCDCREE